MSTNKELINKARKFVEYGSGVDSREADFFIEELADALEKADADIDTRATTA